MLCQKCQHPDLRWYEDIEEAAGFAEISENVVFKDGAHRFEEYKYYIHQQDFRQLAHSKDAGCYICAAIWHAFRTPTTSSTHQQDAIDGETAGDVLASKMANVEACPVVWRVYASRQPKYSTDSWTNFHEWITVFCGNYSRELWRVDTPTGDFLQISHRLEQLWEEQKLLDVDNSTESDSTIELAKLWYDDCRMRHDFCALQDTLDSPVAKLPTRVIDVKSGMENPVLYEPIEEAVGDWIALSHCWGDTKPVDIGGQNEKPPNGAGTAGKECKLPPLSEWPRTFQDAVDVARKFNIRYLWIDNFCIRQGDKEDWSRESQRMAEYFGHATFTLVASWATNDDAGLYHARNPLLTLPLRLIDASTDPAYEGYYISLKGLDEDDPYEVRSPLFTRAWVLQEELLSRRILKFGKNGIYWKCFCSTATPFTTSGTRELPYRHENFGGGQPWMLHLRPVVNIVGLNPYHNLWYNVVGMFTARNMKMKSDVLPAVSGLAQSFASFMGPDERYVAGLWSGDITRGLLWIANRKDTRDFNPPPGTTNYDTRGFCGPSWSWISQCDRQIWHHFHRKILPGGPWDYKKHNVGTEISQITVQHKIKGEIYGEVEGGLLHIKTKLAKIFIKAAPHKLSIDDEQERNMVTKSQSKSSVHLLTIDKTSFPAPLYDRLLGRRERIMTGECDVDDPESDIWRSHVVDGQVEAKFLPLIMYENDYKGARIIGLAILPAQQGQDEYVRIGRVGVEIDSCFWWKRFDLPTQEIILT